MQSFCAALNVAYFMYSGKFFIDTQVLSAYTSTIKKQCFIKDQVIGVSPQNRLRTFTGL